MPAEPEGERDWRPIGQFIAMQRLSRQWTQKQLGEQLGRDASTVSRMEASGTGPHVLEALQLLAPKVLPDLEPELARLVDPLAIALVMVNAELAQGERAMIADGLAMAQAEAARRAEGPKRAAAS